MRNSRFWVLSTEHDSFLIETEYDTIVRISRQTLKSFVSAPLSTLVRRFSTQAGYQLTEVIVKGPAPSWYGPSVFCEEH